MTIVAFAGPSLAGADRRQFPGIEWRPPAEAGDLLRLRADPPAALCLIDGYFDHRPAVRHKEILLLMAEGVRIFGAASIGALRAAEMHPFGMTGVGAIYRAYARDSIEGDDEVALIHAGAERDWRPLSIPMVDVRAILCRAMRERVVAAAEARALLLGASGFHYAERSWEGIFAAAAIPAATLRGFRIWLGACGFSQKNLDAIACINAAMDGSLTKPRRPRAVKTSFLHALARECGVALGRRDPKRVPGGRAPIPAGSRERAADKGPSR